MHDDQVAQVRRFNRFVTVRAGALQNHFLGRDRPLGESRVLYEIGIKGADLRELRARLDLDSGYLSRLVQALAAKGLVTLRASTDDERVRRASLTRMGLAELELINRRSDEAAAAMLEPLSSAQRERLVAAMGEVHRLLRAAGARLERVPPSMPQARWCVAQYFAELGIPWPTFNAVLVTWTELSCGALLLVGLFSRVASIPLIVTMAVAVATAKRAEIGGLSDLFFQVEFTYICMLLVIVVLGPGAASLDGLVARLVDRSAARKRTRLGRPALATG